MFPQELRGAHSVVKCVPAVKEESQKNTQDVIGLLRLRPTIPLAFPPGGTHEAQSVAKCVSAVKEGSQKKTPGISLNISFFELVVEAQSISGSLSWRSRRNQYQLL